MNEKEALETVKQAISPESLSHVQEVVFKQSWEGHLYPEIAQLMGYHPEYIRDVGAQLWRSLSDCIGQKVTKKNVRFVLTNLPADRCPSFSGTQGTTGRRLSQGVNSGNQNSSGRNGALSFARSASVELSPAIAGNQPSFPSVALPVQSAFYIPRPPVEAQAFRELEAPGGLLRIHAPSNMGKTSLLLRALSHARSQGAYTVLINMQEADTAVLEDVGRFLKWFCRNVAQQLQLENRLDEYWDDEIGYKVSCKIYFREYLINRLQSPVVIALDEVDQLFNHPELVQEFLPMLRVWHEEAMEITAWQRLRMALVYSTEVYVPLKISQSPFNVGLSVQLPYLSYEQVEVLAARYDLPPEREVTIEALQRLHRLVGGHPYLVQMAFYWLSEREGTLAKIITEAPTQSGIYSAHLRQHWEVLQRQPSLLEALAAVLQAPEKGAQIDALVAYQLERMGITQTIGNTTTVTIDLYTKYFNRHISIGE